MQVKKQQLELDMEQQTGSKLGKEYIKAVYCSMSSSNCCFLTCIQISQEAGKVVGYSHLLRDFPQCLLCLADFTVTSPFLS